MPELIWDGKYDESGKRPGAPRIALPIQTVETINESAQERQRSLDFFAAERSSEWRNRLIWGDKKYVLPALLDEFAGKVDLIYIDPPFYTGDDFSFEVRIDDTDFTKEPSLIEQKAYRDTWGVTPEQRKRGATSLDRYLGWFYATVSQLHALLSETGSIYVHLDWHVGHYAKVILDDVFGPDHFQNEVIWHYRRWTGSSKRFQKMHDTILLYTKTSNYVFNQLLTAYTAGSKARKEQGVLHRFKAGEEPLLVSDRGVDKEGVPENDVWQIPFVAPSAAERIGYPTQKPEALVERIIAASSAPGALVFDCFAGSGTTAAVAERMGRRWVVSDLSRFAIHTTRKRLLSKAELTPFVVQNLGKYERQLWQEAEFGESAAARTAAYREFILALYHATPISGYAWLHGLKQGRMVHVGTVDAPVTSGDVKQIVAEFRQAVGTGKRAPKEQSVDILGWDFAFELNEIARQDAEKAGIRLRLVRIPREVLEKRAVEQGDIRFFELAALSIDLKTSGRKVTLTVEDFVIPLDDVPAEVQKAVKHWSQWIDYWSVDWDNKDDTFHNEWQAFRTKRSLELDLAITHEYPEPGEYAIVVKVIDILGNDTTRTMVVKVADRGT